MKTRIIVQQDVTKPERTTFDVTSYLFAIETGPGDVMAGLSLKFVEGSLSDMTMAAAELLAASIMAVDRRSPALARDICQQYLDGRLHPQMTLAGKFDVVTGAVTDLPTKPSTKSTNRGE